MCVGHKIRRGRWSKHVRCGRRLYACALLAGALWQSGAVTRHVAPVASHNRMFCSQPARGLQHVPCIIMTDKPPSYAAAKRDAAPSVEHRRSRYLNNRAEAFHQPTRRSDWQKRQIKSERPTRRLLSAHGCTNSHFQLASWRRFSSADAQPKRNTHLHSVNECIDGLC
jgi:putative transposase